MKHENLEGASIHEYSSEIRRRTRLETMMFFLHQLLVDGSEIQDSPLGTKKKSTATMVLLAGAGNEISKVYVKQLYSDLPTRCQKKIGSRSRGVPTWFVKTFLCWDL